jgi:ATP-binding cassette subfamily F protein 1
MLIQKKREQLKEFEKQEKKIKELKASGKSGKQAVSDSLNKSVCLG